ncbi:MAG TPA: hypothetical protein VGC62_26305, partial [Pseudomonas sp.]|uniref:hypothetical protein n=1 Tax=Pseudomonas sp. TaxID=306 RepID=UPI002EDAB40A
MELDNETTQENSNTLALIKEINTQQVLSITHLSTSYAEYFDYTSSTYARQSGTATNIQYGTVLSYENSGTARKIDFKKNELVIVDASNQTYVIALDKISLINGREFSLRALTRLRSSLSETIFDSTTGEPDIPTPTANITTQETTTSDPPLTHASEAGANKDSGSAFYDWKQAMLDPPAENFIPDTVMNSLGIRTINPLKTPVIKLKSAPGNVSFDIQYEASCTAQVGVMLTQEAIDLGIRVLDLCRNDNKDDFNIICTGRSVQIAGFAGVTSGSITFELGVFVPDDAPPIKELIIAYVGVIDSLGAWLQHSAIRIELAAPELIGVHAKASVEHVAWPPLTFSYLDTTTGKTISASPTGEDLADGFHSQALDTGEHNENFVDPRTGLFNASFPIAHLVGNAGRGPVFDLNLNYSALEDNRASLGDGWAFNVSHYNKLTKTLNLAIGKSFSCNLSELKPGKKINQDLANDLKINGICLRYLAPTNLYHGGFEILYKNGESEQLANRKFSNNQENIFTNTDSIAFPFMHVSNFESGHTEPENLIDKNSFILPYKKTNGTGNSIYFRWFYHDDFIFLHWIADDSNVLMSTTVSDNRQTVIEAIQRGTPQNQPPLKTTAHLKLFTGSPEAHSVYLNIENYLLKTATIENTSTQHHFGYTFIEKTGWLLNSVRLSSGLHEVVRYEAQGQAFPKQVKLSALPNVSHHIKINGLNQQNLITRYSFTENNWLGDGAIETIENLENTQREIAELTVKIDKLLAYFNTHYKYDGAPRLYKNLTISHLRNYTLDSLISNRMKFSSKSKENLSTLITELRKTYDRLKTCERSLLQQKEMIAEEDTLIQLNGDYYYETLIEQTVDNSKRLTLIGFNKHHAQTAQIVRCDDTEIMISYSYPETEAFSLAESLKAALLPKTITTTYSDGWDTLEETQTSIFDDSGNIILRTDAQGVTTQWTYYEGAQTITKSTFNLPIELACPAAPNGFTVYVKSEKVSVIHNGKTVDLRWAFYGYEDLELPADQGRAVVPTVCLTILNPTVTHDRSKLKSWHANSTTLEKTLYETDVGSTHYGRSKSVTHILLDEKGKEIPESSVLCKFSYTLKDDQLICREEQTFGDTIVSSQSQSHSIFAGRLLSAIDALDRVSLYTYDILGRQLSVISNPESELYKTEILTTYTPLSEGSRIETTDSLGNKSSSTLDASGRTLQTHVLSDIKGATEWLLTASYEYDAFGRPTGEHRYDHVPGGRTINGEITSYQVIHEGAVTTYDDWGNQWKTEYSDGHTSYRENDPTLRTIKEWDEFGDLTSDLSVTTCNTRGVIESVVKLDANDTELEKVIYTFDAQGLLTNENSIYADEKIFEYDDFGRCIKQQQGSQTIEIAYSAATVDNFATQVCIKDDTLTHVIANRTIDAAGRVISHDQGGLHVDYSYENASRCPVTLTPGDGTALTFTYVPEIDGAVASVSGKTGGMETKKVFSHVTAKQRERISWWETKGSYQTTPERRNVCTQKFDDQDRLIEQHRAEENIFLKSIYQAHTYSLNGRPLSEVNELGIRIDYEYDEHGRCHSIFHEWGVTHLKYRADGALDYEKFKLPCGKNLVTRYSYDKSGREIFRQFEILSDIAEQNPKSSILELSSTFNPDGRLHTATLKTNEDLCRTETYTYTHAGQLQSYSCSGPNKPKDTSGKSLDKQDFTYNKLGNIDNIYNTFTEGKFRPTDAEFLDESHYSKGDYNTQYNYDLKDATRLLCITISSESNEGDFYVDIKSDLEDTSDDTGYGIDPKIEKWMGPDGRIWYRHIPRYSSPLLPSKPTPIHSYTIFGRIIHNNYRYDAYDKLVGSGDSTKTKTEYFYNEYRLSGFTQALSESDSKPYVEGLEILDAKKVNRAVSLTDISRGCRLIN